MGIVETQIRRVPGPVADLSAENTTPDRQVLLDVGRAHNDVGQASNPRVAAGKVIPRRIQRPHHQLDAVAAEVGEPNHVLGLAQRAVRRRGAAGGETEPAQSIDRRVEVIRITHFQADRLHGVVPGRECKRVVSKIRTERRQFLRSVDRLEPEHALREIRRAAEVVDDEAHVTQLLECDHSNAPGLHTSVTC
jgi:hypothetical protein